MAVVKIWVFSGGGESEYRGLINFLRRHFPHYEFERKLPARPGVRPKKEVRSSPSKITVLPDKGKKSDFGLTGNSLRARVSRVLKLALAKGNSCDVLLTLDDLDCRDLEKERKAFSDMLDEALAQRKMDRVLGFAKPELESWLVADWEGTIGREVSLRKSSHAVRSSMKKSYPDLFEAPEDFGTFDEKKGCCDIKLSEELIRATRRVEGAVEFRKAIHTPDLLLLARPERISARCPVFRSWFQELQELGKKS